MARSELQDKSHPYWTAPRGVWLAARSPMSRPYPCRCSAKCGAKCLCRGRVDVAVMPSSCCGRRAVETAARAEAA